MVNLMRVMSPLTLPNHGQKQKQMAIGVSAGYVLLWASASIFVRQTNVVWVVFIMGMFLLLSLPNRFMMMSILT
jgi:hypothetical protein